MGGALLTAISVGAVSMGANIYIGNGPNFMVKAIAEEAGIKMPSFFGYMKYTSASSFPCFSWLPSSSSAYSFVTLPLAHHKVRPSIPCPGCLIMTHDERAFLSEAHGLDTLGIDSRRHQVVPDSRSPSFAQA